jgi:hypothetical protein
MGIPALSLLRFVKAGMFVLLWSSDFLCIQTAFYTMHERMHH